MGTSGFLGLLERSEGSLTGGNMALRQMQQYKVTSHRGCRPHGRCPGPCFAQLFIFCVVYRVPSSLQPSEWRLTLQKYWKKNVVSLHIALFIINCGGGGGGRQDVFIRAVPQKPEEGARFPGNGATRSWMWELNSGLLHTSSVRTPNHWAITPALSWRSVLVCLCVSR